MCVTTKVLALSFIKHVFVAFISEAASIVSCKMFIYRTELSPFIQTITVYLT